MVVSDDWLFRNAFIYQCDGYCEECSEYEECEKRIESERERDTKTCVERTDR